jgi:hypothetical protein
MGPRKLVLSAIAAAGLGLSVGASATPITGEILINGRAVFNTTSLATASSIVSYAATATAGGTGSYASVPDLTLVTFTPFQFSPGLSPTPVNPLWTFNVGPTVYQFIMTSIQVTDQAADELVLAGTGTLTISGGTYSDTAGLWKFSSQSAAGASAARFSFSSDTQPLPEPESLAVMALGLMAIGGIASRRRKQAQAA